jgi:histidinol dehydrogenase
MKINFYHLDTLPAQDKARLLRRAEDDIDSLRDTVQPIIADVRTRGDAALVHYARLLDRAVLKEDSIRVSPAEFEIASKRLDPAVKGAIDDSVENIRKFHRAQMPGEMWMLEVIPGVLAGEKTTPITSVGLYVPRGKGSFPSVMMMLAVPAAIAKVEKVVVCTPPTPEGTVDDASLYAAQACGVSEVYKIGGAGAIAALAYGTQTVPRVAKVIGPGNKYVSAAKRLLYGTIDVGTPAGPSESIVLCDEKADPRLAAHDLLIEAEHGPDSSALLVTHSEPLARDVMGRLPALVAELPEERRRFCEAVLAGFGGVVLTASLDASIAFVNAFAPEHLEVLTENPFETLPRLKNAGEILLGPHTPITVGNFSLGVNAILPTGGFARTFSCVSVHDFLKRSSFACASRAGFLKLAGPASILAEFEGFPSHKRAIAIRGTE